LGDYLTQTGRLAQASDVFEVISGLESDPEKRANALEKAASSYFLAGVPDMAAAMWMRLQAIPGYHDRTIKGQALIAIAQLRFEDAMAILERAGRVPSPLHRLASGARIAVFLSTKDYSRVGKKSAEVFAQAHAWCEAHLALYPDDNTILHSYEYVNWRVQEARGRYDLIVTERSDRLINIGRQWNNQLAAVYLTYGALAYMHRGKGYLLQADQKIRAKADFDKAEGILMEVMVKKDGMLASGDELNIYNLMEAWLSLGWSKYNRGDYKAANEIFGTVVNAQDWPSDKRQSDSVYDWPRQRILSKQLVEAYRGMGTSRDRMARMCFNEVKSAGRQGGHVPNVLGLEALRQKTLTLAAEAVRLHETGLGIGKNSIEAAPARFHHDLNLGIVDEDAGLLREEQHKIVGEGYVTYIHYFDHAVHNEGVFNLAVARYWHAKILREWGQGERAAAEYDKAESEFLEVLKMAPDHAESYRFLEYIYAIHKGDMDRAEAYYKEAQRHGTDAPIDALTKMVEGYDVQLGSGGDAPLQLKRLQYAIALADAEKNPMQLQRVLEYARGVASICKANKAYQGQLEILLKGQHQASLLKILRPCGVNRTPSPR
jgi:tetratricopeptide (TPR) repeat protein